MTCESHDFGHHGHMVSELRPMLSKRAHPNVVTTIRFGDWKPLLGTSLEPGADCEEQPLPVKQRAGIAALPTFSYSEYAGLHHQRLPYDAVCAQSAALYPRKGKRSAGDLCVSVVVETVFSCKSSS